MSRVISTIGPASHPPLSVFVPHSEAEIEEQFPRHINHLAKPDRIPVLTGRALADFNAYLTYPEPRQLIALINATDPDPSNFQQAMKLLRAHSRIRWYDGLDTVLRSASLRDGLRLVFSSAPLRRP